MNRYQPVLDYIENYWGQITFVPSGMVVGNIRNLFLHLGRLRLPNASVAPNHLYFAGSQYYWDSYFTILGLVDSGHGDLARGIVDNFVFLFRRFGLIPSSNSLTSVGRTQPPFLTSMIWEVYDGRAADDDWLDKKMKLAIKEYEKVWNGSQRFVSEINLNRYQPRYLRKLLTVYESGWDVSTRFALGRTHLIPIDLNCMLYKYEVDIIRWAKLRRDKQTVKIWEVRAKLRQAAINQYLWDKTNRFFYDYDSQIGSLDNFKTLAAYYALWSGAASKEQAAQCKNHLKIFEHDFGLAMTEKIEWKHRQWDFPNGWPPLQYVVIKGLRNYGFNDDANRLTNKWLDLNLKVFSETGQLWEKYDVVRGQVGWRGRYPTQPGFGWTNGVFVRLLHESSHSLRLVK